MVGLGGELAFVAAEPRDLWPEEQASLQRIRAAAKAVQLDLAFGEDTRVSPSLHRIAAEAQGVLRTLVEHFGGLGSVAGGAADGSSLLVETDYVVESVQPVQGDELLRSCPPFCQALCLVG